MTPIFVTVVLSVAGALLVGYDIYAYKTKHAWTISWWAYFVSRRHPFVAWIYGAVTTGLAVHFFWTQNCG